MIMNNQKCLHNKIMRDNKTHGEHFKKETMNTTLILTMHQENI